MIYIGMVVTTVILAFFLSICIKFYREEQTEQDERILYVERLINSKDVKQKQRMDNYVELVTEKLKQLEQRQRQLERKKRG